VFAGLIEVEMCDTIWTQSGLTWHIL